MKTWLVVQDAQKLRLRRQEAVGALAAVEDTMNDKDSDDNEEMEGTCACSSEKSTWPPTVAPQLALDPGIWLKASEFRKLKV